MIISQYSVVATFCKIGKQNYHLPCTIAMGTIRLIMCKIYDICNFVSTLQAKLKGVNI
jgi:hypothetical protein